MMSNPNAPRVRGLSPQPFGNPYGDAQQRLAGQLAPQTNVPGTPTNTGPRGWPTLPVNPNGYGYNATDFQQLLTNADGEHYYQYEYGFPEFLRFPSVDYAYSLTDQSLPFDQWLQQMSGQGYTYQNGPVYGMTPAYYEHDQGWIRDQNGMLHNTTTAGRIPQTEAQYAQLQMGLTGAKRYNGQEATYVSGWGASPTNTQMTPRYGFTPAAPPAPPAPPPAPVPPTPAPRHTVGRY